MSTAVAESVHPFDTAVSAGRQPYKVADLAESPRGRAEIRLAEHEMPGLMALRRQHAGERPLAGARVMGSLHMTVQTAVLIETLAELGADVRWASCNIFSTQDHAAAAVAVGHPDTGGTAEAPRGVPVFAWKGETLPEYWWCTAEALLWPDGRGPDLIVDDGGDATLLVHKGYEFERAGSVPAFDAAQDSEEWQVILELLRQTQEEDPTRWRRLGPAIRGVSEETTTGVHRLYEMTRDGTLLFPAINVNDSVTKSKFDNVVRLPPLAARRPGARHRRDARRQGGGGLRLRRGRQGLRAVAARPGLPRGGSPKSTRSARCRPRWRATRSTTLEDVVETADIFITATGNKDIITAEHMARMKDKAIVGNIGHFDNEIDMAGLKQAPGIERINIKPQYDEWRFPDGHGVLVLAEGRLLNLGCATGHPSFVMSTSFTNQVLAQIALHRNTGEYGKQVYMLPKQLDEQVARLHLDHLGVRLTELTPEQAAYIGVPVDGPYKPDHYRY